MTPQEPHPQRCETCDHNKTQPNTILFRCELMKECISLNQSVLIDQLGCATHTSAQQAQQRIDTAIKELDKFEERCVSRCIFRLRKDALLTMNVFDDEMIKLREAIALLREGEKKP